MVKTVVFDPPSEGSYLPDLKVVRAGGTGRQARTIVREILKQVQDDVREGLDSS